MKEYWFAPERRDQTFARFGNFFAWLNVAVAAEVIAINQIVLTANVMQKDPNPMALWTVLGTFFAFIAIFNFRKFETIFRNERRGG